MSLGHCPCPYLTMNPERSWDLAGGKGDQWPQWKGGQLKCLGAETEEVITAC